MKERKRDERSKEAEILSPQEAGERSRKEFEKFYVQLLVGSAIVVLMGIAVAVLVSVPVGAVIFVAGCGIYLYFTRDELKKCLGLGYKRCMDGWAVTPVAAEKKESLWIPERLMGLPVTELFLGEESAVASLREIGLPASICRLEKDLFERLPNLQRVYFLGTEEQWEKIEKPTLPSGCEWICLNEAKESD